VLLCSHFLIVVASLVPWRFHSRLSYLQDISINRASAVVHNRLHSTRQFTTFGIAS
jgi:hypothetical protein